MEEQEFIDRALLWRGINSSHVCPECEGSGSKLYGNTTTWMGGVGGQTMRRDVCNECWGTGDLGRPGANLRKLMQAQAEPPGAITLYGTQTYNERGKLSIDWYFDYKSGEQEPIEVQTFNNSKIYKEALELQMETWREEE